nr:MAG TPA: hypothetical protein [Caudoviricetes sp.]
MVISLAIFILSIIFAIKIEIIILTKNEIITTKNGFKLLNLYELINNKIICW